MNTKQIPTLKSINMADLRRRKPDDDSGKQNDDDTFGASRPDRRIGDGGSDDEQPQSHHKKLTATLSTADSSDHVNITDFFFQFLLFFAWLCLFQKYEKSKKRNTEELSEP